MQMISGSSSTYYKNFRVAYCVSVLEITWQELSHQLFLLLLQLFCSQTSVRVHSGNPLHPTWCNRSRSRKEYEGYFLDRKMTHKSFIGWRATLCHSILCYCVSCVRTPGIPFIRSVFTRLFSRCGVFKYYTIDNNLWRSFSLSMFENCHHFPTPSISCRPALGNSIKQAPFGGL